MEQLEILIVPVVDLSESSIDRIIGIIVDNGMCFIFIVINGGAIFMTVMGLGWLQTFF